MPTPTPQSSHIWKFYRIGGLDQVSVESAEDLLNLKHLDQKLWVALSCPVKGLELDEKTLSLIDLDKDGRIRVPELLAAIDWIALRLKDVGAVLTPGDSLLLEQLSEATPEGRAVRASAKQILAALGKAESEPISLVEACDPVKVFAAARFNGDGVITASIAEDGEVAAVIKDIMLCHGADKDRGGEEGVTVGKIEGFYADLAAYVAWSESGLALQGKGIAEAAAAVQAVRAKVEDFFARAKLVAFDARAGALLNRAEADLAALGAKELTSGAAEIAAFPLARVDAQGLLSFSVGVNPAWAAALGRLYSDAVVPLLGAGRQTLSEADWRTLLAKVDPWLNWQAAKVGASVEKLGLERAKAILTSKAKEKLLVLVGEDQAVAAEFAAIGEVEKLLRFRRDLRVLLANFVNFFDFYSKERHAVFEAGTLYLDGRSTELCVRVDGPSGLAGMSKAFIAYCQCTRPGGAAMTVAACFTQGDSDFLFVGRHGVLYDRNGKDWDAVITSIVDNPISIGQAFWSPYKKLLRMIEEQISKRAAAADAEAGGKLAKTAEGVVHADKVKPEAPKKFDLALITGMGVALGAIGTFLATIFAKVVELRYWQFPILLLGLMLVISLPAMIIAWIKLRQRNLGPILEANGWAVNGRVMINIPFGTALTDKAALPVNAKRSLSDPYEDESAKKARRTGYLVLLLALLAYVAAAWHFKLWPLHEEETSPVAPAAAEGKAEPVTDAKAGPAAVPAK